MNISVIIPVYNAELFLRKAVESALQFKEVKEVLLIEDGSPDNALKVCKELLAEDKRIKLFQHPNNENRGAAASRNLGLKYASEDYIAFLDADDYYLPNRFEKDKQVFENYPDADGAYNAIGVHFYSDNAKKSFGKTFILKEGKEFLTTLKKVVEPQDLFRILVNPDGQNVGYFSLDGLTFRKSALNKIKDGWFKNDLRLHQDTEFLIRLSFYTKLYCGNIHEATAMRGVHSENRIIDNENDKYKKIENRFKMYVPLYQWANKEELDEEILIFFKSKVVHTDVYKQAGAKMLFVYLKHILTTKGFLTKEEFKKTRTDMKQILRNKFFSNKTIK